MEKTDQLYQHSRSPMQSLDLEYEVAALYAIHQTFAYVAWEMKKKTKHHWTIPEVKKYLVRYLREQVDIKTGLRKPPITGFKGPQKASVAQ